MKIIETSYSTWQYREGLRKLIIDDVDIYLSWGNPIGFQLPSGEVVLRQNKEGDMSTGMHLNVINKDKKVRIDADRFDQLIDTIFQFRIVEEEPAFV